MSFVWVACFALRWWLVSPVIPTSVYNSEPADSINFNHIVASIDRENKQSFQAHDSRMLCCTGLAALDSTNGGWSGTLSRDCLRCRA